MQENYAVSWKIKQNPLWRVFMQKQKGKNMKNVILFCTGVSGSGKSHFIQHYLSPDAFHNLKSATTREKRNGEQDGCEYYFRNEEYFDTEKFVTKLWVNEKLWKPGDKKWMYGVPEFEVWDNLGYNFTYDVIEPKYIRQMMDWFKNNRLTYFYDFKILWFQPNQNASKIIESRQNMPNDALVRKINTCTFKDFTQVHLSPDFQVINSEEKQRIDQGLLNTIHEFNKMKIK